MLEEIAATPKAKVTALLQQLYTQPIQPDLIAERVQQMKEQGVIVRRLLHAGQRQEASRPIAVEAGCDIFVVQSTVTTARHISTSLEGLRFEKLCP